MLAQILIGISFAIASYQDVKDRAVSDAVWLPALAGAALSLYQQYPDLTYPIVKLALVGGIALAFTFFGAIGQADAIGLALIGADPYRFSPIAPLFAAAMVALAHIVYELVAGNARGSKTIPMEKFLKEQRWIPRAVVAKGVRTEVGRDVNSARDEVEADGRLDAMVEVTYGVPTVAYLGIGYVAFLVFLAVFIPPVLFSLP